MSRIIIIGGSGHVGSYLVPALVTMGYEVVNVSRGISAPYRTHSAWEQVESVILARTAEEAKGEFGTKIAALEPDIVVDRSPSIFPAYSSLLKHFTGRLITSSSVVRFGSTGASRQFHRRKQICRIRLNPMDETWQKWKLGWGNRRGAEAFWQRASDLATSSEKAGYRSIRWGT